MQFNSPLRYPGGKARLSQYVAELLALNSMVGARYAEPYAGGAGVALTLLYREYVSHIHLNDLNRSVHAFWWAATHATDRLCARVLDCQLDIDEWQRQRAVQRADEPDVEDLAFSTLYMNRTNRSGVVRGGVIGGLKQDGPWKMDARFNRADIVKRIEKVGNFASRITISRLDALEFLKSGLPPESTPTLVYLDPPYFKKADKLYDNHYKAEDHVSLASAVASIPHRWIVSYDCHDEICDLYKAYTQQQFGISYSAGPVAKGKEVMIFGPGVKRPADIVTWRGIAA
ncbi:DNA adenine methylase [Brevundimonas naejangsanensis]|uniref:DNA adenine methylase n=1 Tax=Brevundimonas naejangsanensis TaxID=588932 RepID=UPI0026E9F7F4|nr:DNA adenine methylase [Brevundimonas naejangsanensis]